MTIVFYVPLPPSEKIVLLAMADFADDHGRRIYPSMATLARKTSLHPRTLRRVIQGLIGLNPAPLIRVREAKHHRPAAYRLDLKVLRDLTKQRGQDVPPESDRGDTVSAVGGTDRAIRGDTTPPNPLVEATVKKQPLVTTPADAAAAEEPRRVRIDDEGNEVDERGRPAREKRGRRKAEPWADLPAPVQLVLRGYIKVYAEHHGGDEPSMAWGQCGDLAKALLRLQPPEVILELAADFMRLPLNVFLSDAGQGFPMFHLKFNALCAARRRRIETGSSDPAVQAIIESNREFAREG